ncbi:uncharacterized protein TrAtP1_003192 [Trichoderma atroviride]|uniref:uncharacterized protein n=1 Tax=Hypocrea atroviridis TaxID=63577 RepID=UPI003325A5AD|nr:hypothetical protein TrAtP1_003192 [Trichoderma atroviride]
MEERLGGLAHTGRYYPRYLRALVPSLGKQNGLATRLRHAEASNAVASAVMLLVLLLAVGTATSSPSQCRLSAISVPSPRRLCRNKEWRTLCSVKVNLHALAPGARLKHTAAPRLSSMRRCCFLIHSPYLRITALFALPSQRFNLCSETGHCDPTAPCPALRLVSSPDAIQR